MPPKSFAAEGDRDYSVHDVVLARTQRNPYWPAHVRRCPSPDDPNRGEWLIEEPNGGIGLVWCVFIASDASPCWVSMDNIKAFSITHAEYTLCRCRTENTKRRLSAAIQEARSKLRLSSKASGSSNQSEEIRHSMDTANDVDMEPASSSNEDDEQMFEIVMDDEEEDESAAMDDSDVIAPTATATSPSELSTGEKITPVRQTISLPGDLVLAKTGTYPFWPAIVSRCVSEKKKWNNKWVLYSSKNETPVRIWCAFVGDSTGGWVPMERVRPYNPAAAHQLVSKPKSSLYGDHIKAIRLADEIHRTKRRLKVPTGRRHIAPSKTTPTRSQGAPRIRPERSKSANGANHSTPSRKSGPIATASEPAISEYLLDDLVLAKYDPSCPYWPALIRECQELHSGADKRGKWRLPAEGDTPARICCYFIVDGSETWVSVDVIKKFTPARARYYLCARSSSLYDVQREAISKAAEMLKQRNGSGTKSTNEEVVNWREGDIVLADFDRAPFWPAKIQKCSESNDKHHGEWKKTEESESRTETMYYCSFLLNEKSKWTRSTSIRKFSPARARSYPCDKHSKLYKIQREAINLAMKLEESKVFGDQRLTTVESAPGTATENGSPENDVTSHSTEKPCSTSNDNGEESQVESTVPVEEPIIFALNDLAVAKYNHSAFWPVRIATDVEDSEKRWKREGVDGEQDQYFSEFINHTIRRWVPHDELKPFTPHRARRFLVGRTSPVYQKNREAVKQASLIYNARMNDRGEEQIEMEEKAESESVERSEPMEIVSNDSNVIGVAGSTEATEVSGVIREEVLREKALSEKELARRALDEGKHSASGMMKGKREMEDGEGEIKRDRDAGELVQNGKKAEKNGEVKGDSKSDESSRDREEAKKDKNGMQIDESSEEQKTADRRMSIARAEAVKAGKRSVRLEVIEASGTVKRRK